MLLEILSRIQFGFTISFNTFFPAFSIGLVTYIAIMEGVWIKTKDPHYHRICKFWTKVLTLTFGMGILSGLVMAYQLGTNWSGFTQTLGNVLDALLTYKVITVCLIEAGLLGVMFFGWNRVSPELHYLATLFVFAGLTLSAFMIMAANSWMQAPAGTILRDGTFIIQDWVKAIFNPLFLPRYFHMLLASYISSLLVIIAVSAFYLLHNRFVSFARTCFSFGLWSLLLLVPLQIYIGDAVGIVVNKYQPLKTAAIEGVWKTQKGAPLILFALPDQDAEENDFVIKIPKLASLLNTHKMEGELKGLKTVAPSERPYVPVVFWSFRIMVGLGIVMLWVVFSGLYLRIRKKLYTTRWFLKSCLWTAPAGFLSIIMGWLTAEFGRQPWIVYHYLRTLDVHSPITLNQVFISLIIIVFVYGIIFGYFYFRYLFNFVKQGPEDYISPLERTFYYMAPIFKKIQ